MATQAQFDGRLIPPAGSRWHSSLARTIAERRARALERIRGRRFDRYVSRREPAKKKKGRDPREALPQGDDIQALGDAFGADGKQIKQALAYGARRLHAKAKRLVLCHLLGKRQNCEADDSHRYFRSNHCEGRYCQWCGPAWFRKKFSELLFLLPSIVERLMSEGRNHGRRMVIAKIDFTVPNHGTMPTPAFVRQFHKDIHRFWRAVERRFGISRGEYGWAGNDEFGGSNTNLHRHCLYVGPYLPQRESDLKKLGYKRWRRKGPQAQPSVHLLSDLWSEIRGERSFVSIKPAQSFPVALAHALKYPAKFVSRSSPERLADLEAAFHKTRRFSTGAAFYGLKPIREPGDDSPVGDCPICGARLSEVVEAWVPRFVLQLERRSDIEEARQQVGKERTFMGTGPP